MKTRLLNPTRLMGLGLLLSTAAYAQTPAHGVLYQIQSGTYVEEGGFAGELSYPLPTAAQMFVSLRNEPGTRTAHLTFLDQNFQPNFFFPPLTNGVGTADGWRFRDRTAFPVFVPNLATVDYLVLTNEDALEIDGSVAISYAPCHCICADCWTGFAHQAVHAIRMPSVSIRLNAHVDQVDLCWNTSPGSSYQPLYATDLNTNDWLPLSPPIDGNGSTVCVQDKLTQPEPQRFYRIAIVPGPR